MLYGFMWVVEMWLQSWVVFRLKAKHSQSRWHWKTSFTPAWIQRIAEIERWNLPYPGVTGCEKCWDGEQQEEPQAVLTVKSDWWFFRQIKRHFSDRPPAAKRGAGVGVGPPQKNPGSKGRSFSKSCWNRDTCLIYTTNRMHILEDNYAANTGQWPPRQQEGSPTPNVHLALTSWQIQAMDA